MNTQGKQPSGWGKLVAGIALSLAAFFAQGIAVIVSSEVMKTLLDETQLFCVGEIASGLVALLFICALGGLFYVKPSLRGMGYGFKMLKIILIMDVILLVISVVEIFIDPTYKGPPSSWFVNLVVSALLCLGIGMFEEGVFRGLLLQGLLARMGTNKKGIVAAILISSLLFGFAHVVPEAGAQFTVDYIAQMVLKTLQTGMLGVILAVVVIKTHSLWPAIVLHGLSDFLLMAPTMVLVGDDIDTEYVLTGDDGIVLIVVYTVVCLIYLPPLIKSLRELKAMQVPHRGIFYRMRPVAAYSGSVPIGPVPPSTAVLEGQHDIEAIE